MRRNITETIWSIVKVLFLYLFAMNIYFLAIVIRFEENCEYILQHNYWSIKTNVSVEDTKILEICTTPKRQRILK